MKNDKAEFRKETEESPQSNMLTMAAAWKQTAAEYRALYYQGYNIATARVQEACRNRKAGDRPLAVITDLDDTVVLPLRYWGTLIAAQKEFFDDDLWANWLPKYEMIPAPGAPDFLKLCKESDVAVFYITSRNQGDKTTGYVMEQLKRLEYPYADETHVTVLIGSSDKEARQKEIAKTHEIVCFLGDNMNDFRRAYYECDVKKRMARMEEDKALFGNRFILFPNPTDGQWIRAIFGVSEPEASPENREKFEKAAKEFIEFMK